MVLVKASEEGDTLRLFGIPFKMGEIFRRFAYNQVCLLNVFAVINTSLVLLSRGNDVTRSVFGFTISRDTCVPYAVLRALLYTTVLHTGVGLGSVEPCGPVALAVSTIQALMAFALNGQLLFLAIFPGT